MAEETIRSDRPATKPAGRLPLGTKLGFGIADLGGNLFFTAMGFWTLFYLTDVVGVPAALAGAVFWIGKLWDAVTDPLTGWLSDRTRTRLGRRRPWMLAGAIPMFLAMWFFFSKPAIESPWALAAWAALALMLLNTAYTLVNIPYSSLTPDLTDDYNERMSLNAYRFGFAVIGTMVGAAAVQPIVSLFPSQSAGFSAAGAALGVVMAMTALVTVASVREGPHSRAPVPKEGFFETFVVVFRDKAFLVLLFTYALNLTALAFVQTTLAYYFKWLYRDEGATTLAMVILLVVAMVFIPVSVLVSKHIGKKRTYQICFVILAVSTLLIWAFGHTLGMDFFLGVMVFAGVGIGFGYAAPWAMLPDVVELDALRTGKRKEGAFYGVWTFMSKVGTAASAVVTGFVLQTAGYSSALESQGESALTAIRLLIGPVPALVFLVALFLVERYPVDGKSYAAALGRAEEAAS
ncbi:MAG: MFS transporter [Spirochaetales bacterium]|nr:MFS transporter [Spirochaetales bacterium]